MNRKTKNIVMIVLIVLMSGCLVFTMSIAESSSSSNQMTQQMSTNMPNQSQESSQGSENDSNQSQSQQDTNGENSSGSEQSSNQQMTQSPSMPSNNQGGDSQRSLSTIYYIVFVIEGGVISLIMMYLIVSRMNQKSWKEIYQNKDKVVIIMLSTVIVTTAITITSGQITTRYFLSDNHTQTEMMTNQEIVYSADTEITEDTTIDSGEYASTSSNENAILVDGATATLSSVSVTKSGDSDGGDNSNFFGTNAAILAKNGSQLTLKNITVSTTATGANGVFSFGGSATTNNTSSDNTTVTISDSKITTTGDNAGGIMTTGGGVMNANNLTIETSGVSSAAIRTDRGGGRVVVDQGTYTTNGAGSPTVYSTADITVKNATLTATASEGVVIEGQNSVTLENCTLTDTNNQLNGQSTTYKNIFLYQSMSGDASSGTASFEASDCDIVTNKGDTFYVTNTSASITLSNNTITNNDSTGNFLRIQKDSWGQSGSNGGDVTLKLSNQKVTGDIVVDSISTLNMSIEDGSYWEGSLNSDNTAKSITLTLSKDSSIKLTGDCYVTSLETEDTTYSHIDFNGYKLYVNNTAIN